MHTVTEHNLHIRRDQLQQVAVTRQDYRFDLLIFRLTAEAADHVVGLVPGHVEDRDLEGLHEAPHPIKLWAQLWRRRRAVRLVVCELLVAESGFREIEGDGAVGRVVVGKSSQEGVEESVDGADLLACLGDV